MPDREKVIKEIEICYTVGHNCTECPLFNEDDCNDRLMRDALDLLRKQEPVEPTWRRGLVFCGKCGRQFGRGFKYCPDCGKKVKWDVKTD